MVKFFLLRRYFLLAVFLLCPFFCFGAAQDADRYFDSGSKNMQSGDMEGAVSDFTKVIELSPATHEAYYNRGAARANIFGKKDALERTKVLLSGNSPLINEAIADFTKAIQLAPNTAQYYSARGSAYLFIRQSKNAVADFNKVIELNPSQADAYFSRGLSYIVGGNLKDGWADIDKSKKMGYAPAKDAQDNLQKVKQ